MNKNSDIKQLIVEIQKGDELRFAEVYDYYKNELYFFIVSISKNKSDAEDILQEAFLTAFEKIDSLKKPESFKSWLYTIAYNKAMNINNNIRGKSESLDDRPYLEREYKRELMNEFDREIVMTEIVDAMEELTPKLYVVAELKYFQGFTIKEISHILDISDNTVKNRLLRTKKIMARSLEEKGIVPQSSSSSVATTLALSFQLMSHSYILNSEIDQKILKEISEVALREGPAHFGVGQLFFEGLKKFFVGTVLVGTTVVAGATIIEHQKSDIEIKEVSYNKNWTNEGVDVNLLLDRNISKSDSVQIRFNEKNLAVESSGKNLRFTAYENGQYQVICQESKIDLDITNIDYVEPKLISASYNKDVLTLVLEDKESGIDYDKSYLIQDGRKFPVSPQGKVIGKLEGDVEIVIYDYALNISKYAITISEDMEGE